MDKHLLEILRCPKTGQSLSFLTSSQLQPINRAVQAGDLAQENGHPITHPFKEGLITSDLQYVYRIDTGIPVMLEGESLFSGKFFGTDT